MCIRDRLRPHIGEIASISPFYVSAHPNAGLPNEFGEYDQTPDEMAREIRDYAKQGFVNIVGGCCGTTPEHIGAIVGSIRDLPPRSKKPVSRDCSLSWLEPLYLSEETLFVNVAYQTNFHATQTIFCIYHF